MEGVKKRLLTEGEIEVKVKTVTEKGVLLLLYKTARTDMDILDELYGADGWTNDYKEIKGVLYAGIGIKQSDGSFLWKWDCGIESREDGGNEKKGESSDAFKRAGFRVGIGRELYTAPLIWVSAEKTKIEKDRNGKPACRDRFAVEAIKYDENNNISGLSIINGTGKHAFVWKAAKKNDEA